MDIKEFRQGGYLQEVNRQFLHPLGLALEVEIDDETGSESLGGIWDYRDDPEGMLFADGMIDLGKVKRIRDEKNAKSGVRVELIGSVIQAV